MNPRVARHPSTAAPSPVVDPQTGLELYELRHPWDFPHWEPAHKILMANGIPGIEHIGGDLDAVTGKRCTLAAFPWRWTEGEGSGVVSSPFWIATGDTGLARTKLLARSRKLR